MDDGKDGDYPTSTYHQVPPHPTSRLHYPHLVIGVVIKNGKILEKIQKMSEIQIWTFENPWGSQFFRTAHVVTIPIHSSFFF